MNPTWTDVGTFVIALAALAFLFVSTWYTRKAVGQAADYARRQIFEAREASQVQLLTELWRQWETEMYQAPRKQLAHLDPGELKTAIENSLSSDLNDFYALIRIPSYFELLAVLVNEGRIRTSVVKELLGSPAIQSWEQWEDTVDFLRDWNNQPTAFRNFQQLAAALKKE